MSFPSNPVTWLLPEINTLPTPSTSVITISSQLSWSLWVWAHPVYAYHHYLEVVIIRWPFDFMELDSGVQTVTGSDCGQCDIHLIGSGPGCQASDLWPVESLGQSVCKRCLIKKWLITSTIEWLFSETDCTHDRHPGLLVSNESLRQIPCSLPSWAVQLTCWYS